MAESAREMGQEVAMEVYGLFATHIPQHGRAAMRELSSRTRHGLVPDFMMWIRLGRDPVKQYLLELKCAIEPDLIRAQTVEAAGGGAGQVVPRGGEARMNE